MNYNVAIKTRYVGQEVDNAEVYIQLHGRKSVSKWLTIKGSFRSKHVFSSSVSDINSTL